MAWRDAAEPATGTSGDSMMPFLIDTDVCSAHLRNLGSVSNRGKGDAALSSSSADMRSPAPFLFSFRGRSVHPELRRFAVRRRCWLVGHGFLQRNLPIEVRTVRFTVRLLRKTTNAAGAFSCTRAPAQSAKAVRSAVGNLRSGARSLPALSALRVFGDEDGG